MLPRGEHEGIRTVFKIGGGVSRDTRAMKLLQEALRAGHESAGPRRAGGGRGLGGGGALVVAPRMGGGGWPVALKRGLATLEGRGGGGLGLERWVFRGPARMPADARAAQALQRLANAVLSQLHLMVPQRDKPVRASKVAQFAAQIAMQLADAPPATRVGPPEVVGEAPQSGDIAAFTGEWLPRP